jgi:glycogen debranching enzyme GlgX
MNASPGQPQVGSPTSDGSGAAILEAGRPYPLGATCTGRGVNFAVFSEHAARVVLCLFDPTGSRESGRLELTEHTDGVWHGHLPGAGAGLVYGYRTWGPSEPDKGLRFNPCKLLLDPYSRRFTGEFRWADAHLDDARCASLDNARYIFKSTVAWTDQDLAAAAARGHARADSHEAQAFDWDGDRAPATPLDESVLYEVHVKGFTRLHPDVPQALRGTYEGFCSPPAIAHLKRLGVTAVELLPVQQSVSEQPLALKGLVNYWGYSTIGFFAPDRRFAREDPVREFKTMVRELHRAGIEVILDVVYNHTAEGDHRGPTLSMRGLDNRAYYHLRRTLPGHYENYTGTGNSLNLGHPRVLQMVMDSLRYWVTEMHVDGFRFDLATTLGRHRGGEGSGDEFDRDAAFFQAVRQDPVLAGVKLFAEPWDIGMGGYQVGHFPAGWSEWNDRYRDTTRSFWISKGSYRGDMARRLGGSADVFRHGGRRPQAGLNYVTAHDGFTLQDVVSYSHKHNEANGEDNRDGSSDNRSWNCGLEGPTDMLMIQATRARLKRALLATLLLSQGVPMLLGGDEMGRTQRGNNNAYNQDNDISWFDWRSADAELVEFTAWLIGLRRRYPQLRSTHWLHHHAPGGGPGETQDAVWLHRQGSEMTAAQWEDGGRYVFGLQLAARRPEESDLLLLLNAEATDAMFYLPAGNWQPIMDTGSRDGRPGAGAQAAEARILLKARSLTLLQGT